MEPITLQTNLPIKPQCGIYYFEIRVIQKGQDGNFAIGFSRKNNKINKLPGVYSLKNVFVFYHFLLILYIV